MDPNDLERLVLKPPPPGGWPRGWQLWDVTRQVHHRLADRVFGAKVPYPEGRFSGRGVVIPAGGSYLPGAYVNARLIRHYGCTLPIQVWHFEDEVPSQFATAFGRVGVDLVNMSRHPAILNRRVVAGFESKLFAVMSCPFEEVLVLDADCYPCTDVTHLFEDDRFQQAGATYWPDLPHADAWTHWEFWGVEPFFGPPLETGQYLVNKRKAWDVLRLAEWYDDHSDWCYGGGQFSDHGDKGPHRVAWAKHRREFNVHTHVPEWRGCAFVHAGPNGKPALIHRARSKLMLVQDRKAFRTTRQNGHNIRAGLPGESEAFAYLGELANQVKPERVVEVKSAAPVPKVRRGCRHLGPVLEFCTSCHGVKAESRNVHDCEVHDRCTLGFVSNRVQSCLDCKDFVV